MLVKGRSLVLGPPKDDDAADDLCVGLVDRPGPVDETYGVLYGRPNLTLVVRSAPGAPSAGFELCVAIFNGLTANANVTFGATSFVRFEPMAYPARLRLDSQNRIDWTAELGVWLDE